METDLKDFPSRDAGNITQHLVVTQVSWMPRPGANTNTPRPRMSLVGAKFISSLCGYHLSNTEREKERRQKGGRRSGSGGGLGAYRLLRPHDFPGCFQGTAETRAYEFHVIAYLRKHIRNVVCISHPLATPPDCGLPGTRCILPIHASGNG